MLDLKEISSVTTVLQKSEGFIKRELAKMVDMPQVPKLNFLSIICNILFGVLILKAITVAPVVCASTISLSVIAPAPLWMQTKLSSAGKVAGSYVLDGKIVRNGIAKIKRGDEIIGEAPAPLWMQTTLTSSFLIASKEAFNASTEPIVSALIIIESWRFHYVWNHIWKS